MDVIPPDSLVVYLSNITKKCSKCGSKFKLLLRDKSINDSFIKSSFIDVIYGGELGLDDDNVFLTSIEWSEYTDTLTVRCQDCYRSNGNILDKLYYKMFEDVGTRMEIRVMDLYFYIKQTNDGNITLLEFKCYLQRYMEIKTYNIYKKYITCGFRKPQVLIDKIKIKVLRWNSSICSMINVIEKRLSLDNNIPINTLSFSELEDEINILIYGISIIMIHHIKDNVRDFNPHRCKICA